MGWGNMMIWVGYVMMMMMMVFVISVHGSGVNDLEGAILSEEIGFAPSLSPFQQHNATSGVRVVSLVETLHHGHHHHHRNRSSNSSPAPSYALPPDHSHQAAAPAPAEHPVTPSESPSSPGPTPVVSPVVPSPSSPSAFAPSPKVHQSPSPQPSISPASVKSPPPRILVLPPPPPNNEDCSSLTCPDPLTNSIAGQACACVWPIQVKLSIGVSLYTFFPLVSVLASEIASSLLLNQSQVRITGADTANQQQDAAVVLLNLVPAGSQFNSSAAFSIYEKFLHKQLKIDSSLFGPYQVIYVNYPGLPSSPPPASSNGPTVPSNAFHGNLPEPVNLPHRRKKGISTTLIAVIVLSSFIALVACAGIGWILVSRCQCSPRPRCDSREIAPSLSPFVPPLGAGKPMILGSTASTASLSLHSSLLTFGGSAKIFSLGELDRATNGFDNSSVVGEGGFGVVYGGVLDDSQKVAVKVLKRGDQQGGREFLAEVEMLSRLHHRNLVKLIGICAEDLIRCLVYELIPNGSVESHLHGSDKRLAPLDWGARMKIALGAARGLAYLHEDSSPCVIHRDFKASNILLEYDFTPKVSDFGLAKVALNEENQLTSTQVMGTFGYVAPEYAMTGHLLVKSDVYSYGVVLLELLTGRKPVDLSKPPGQENLVAWARPLLTIKEGIEAIIDPALEPTVQYDSFAKVAAIASMCVQPEVSLRPFMGEVVQALKLVCNEFDDPREEESRSFHELAGTCIDVNSNLSETSADFVDFSPSHHPVIDYGSSPEARVAFSTTDLLSVSGGLGEEEYPSFRRPFNSGPLKLGKKKEYWQRISVFSGGSASEHGYPYIRWSGSR
ncbi:Receptor-like serine/threonine-protein kinase ALE2-like protein [Drosera capensis]